MTPQILFFIDASIKALQYEAIEADTSLSAIHAKRGVLQSIRYNHAQEQFLKTSTKEKECQA